MDDDEDFLTPFKARVLFGSIDETVNGVHHHRVVVDYEGCTWRPSYDSYCRLLGYRRDRLPSKDDLYALRYSAGPEKLGEARPVRRHPMLDHPYGRAARPAESVTLLLCARMSAVLNVALVAFIVIAYFLKRLH